MTSEERARKALEPFNIVDATQKFRRFAEAVVSVTAAIDAAVAEKDTEIDAGFERGLLLGADAIDLLDRAFKLKGIIDCRNGAPPVVRRISGILTFNADGDVVGKMISDIPPLCPACGQRTSSIFG